MKVFFRTGFLMLAVWLGLSGVSFAKQVFMKDGSVLDCESFWRRNGQLVVKVNRDIILEFTPDEVNLRKTLQQSKHKASGMKRKSRHATYPKGASAAGVPASATQAAASPDLATPVPPSAPVPTPAAAKTAAEPAPAPSAAPAAAAVPKAASAAQPEPAPATSPEPAPALSKEELERRTRENVEMIAEAIKKNDPELMKEALAAQKSLAQQQNEAQENAPTGPDGLKPEPSWFKYLLMLAFSGLLIIIAMWVVFEKAGHSGVKSIIPIYNFYVLMQISGKPGWWCFLLLVPVVGFAIQLLAMLSLADKFQRSAAFGVGLLLLPMFFFPLLAFGGSKYGGTPEELDFTFSEEPPVP